MLFNPATESFETLDPRTREIMKLTVEFFEKKGKAQLKEDDHERVPGHELKKALHKTTSRFLSLANSTTSFRSTGSEVRQETPGLPRPDRSHGRTCATG